MKKRFGIPAALLAAALLAACGGSSESYASSASVANGSYYDESAAMEGEYGGTDSGTTPTLDPSAQNTEQKIVYTADMRIEATDFAAARDAFLAAVEDTGAWLEHTYVSGCEEDHDRYASYTVRVPAENYRTFLEQAGKGGSVSSLSEDARNITENYIDVQARLAALEAQRDRLNALADKAETTADLLEIENQLTDVQYELESYTGKLRAMDSQVMYSTVEATLNEVAVYSPTASTSFGQRIADAFSEGGAGFVSFVQGLAIAVVYLWPLLLIVAAVVAAVILWRRKHPRKPKPKPAAPAPAAYEAPAETQNQPKYKQ